MERYGKMSEMRKLEILEIEYNQQKDKSGNKCTDISKRKMQKLKEWKSYDENEEDCEIVTVPYS